MTSVYYFGPLARSGHFMYNPDGYTVMRDEEEKIPWKPWDIDGKLQPGCYQHPRDGRWEHNGPENEGEALLHHKDGWTALSFWDRTIDTRYACNSTFIANGIFTFEEMVALAKEKFPGRWAAMKFEVRLSQERKSAE